MAPAWAPPRSGLAPAWALRGRRVLVSEPWPLPAKGDDLTSVLLDAARRLGAAPEVATGDRASAP